MAEFKDSPNNKTPDEEIIKEIEADNEKEYLKELKKKNEGFLVENLSILERERIAQHIIDQFEDVKDKHKELLGRPVMYNHKVEGMELPVGHYIESTINDDGWFYAADIDPEEKDLIRKLRRGDLRHVSIQLIGGKKIIWFHHPKLIHINF